MVLHEAVSARAHRQVPEILERPKVQQKDQKEQSVGDIEKVSSCRARA